MNIHSDYKYQVRYFVKVIEGTALNRECCEWFTSLNLARDYINRKQGKIISLFGGGKAELVNFTILDRNNQLI